MKETLRGLCRPAAALALGLGVSRIALAAEDPPQRFLVLMEASPAPQSDPQGYGVFDDARQHVVDLLFKSGAEVSGRPWYRFGTDTITLIESGPGPRSTEALSAEKDHWNIIDFDYARPVTRPWIKLRRTRFEQLFYPRSRPHQVDTGRALAASFRSWDPASSRAHSIHLVVMRESENRPESILPAVRDHFDTIGRNYRLETIHQTRFYYNPTVTFWVETADLVPGLAPVEPSSSSEPGRRGTILQKVGKALAGLALLGMAAWLSRWVWYQRSQARHFELWIPDLLAHFHYQ